MFCTTANNQALKIRSKVEKREEREITCVSLFGYFIKLSIYH
jgi:hypothetical protein